MNTRILKSTYPAEFVFTLCAGIHESLGDDRERGVHHFRHVDVKSEVRIFEYIHPEPQGKAGSSEYEMNKKSVFFLHFITITNVLHIEERLVWESLPEVLLSAVQRKYQV